MPPGFRVHPDPVVRHFDHDVGAESEPVLRVQRVGRRRDRDFGARDDQATARDHRVTGVEHDVHQHLLDLAAVGPDPADAGVEPQVELDVGPQQARQHLRDVRDDGVGVDDLRRQHLAPAEREQLLRDTGGPPPRLHHFLDVRALGTLGWQAAEGVLPEAKHRGHHVVHLVRDAARERPHRLHALRLAQPLLVGLSHRDVGGEADESVDRSLRIAVRNQRDQGGPGPAVPVAHLGLVLDPFAGERPLDERPNAGVLRGAQHASDGLTHERPRLQAEPLAEAGVRELVAILAIDVDDEHGERVDDQPKLALALLHLAAGVNLLGDVHRVDQDGVHLRRRRAAAGRRS